MAKRVVTKIGDVFSVPISETEKRYIQLIAFDITQLNSDVIRVFNKIYPMNENPNLDEITNDGVLLYVHCVTKFGVKLDLWEKVGNNKEVGDINEIIFKDTNDYGIKLGEEPIRVSDNWHIWRIGDDKFTKVGKLVGENRNAYMGLVINPKGIVEMVKGNIYPPNYPGFE